MIPGHAMTLTCLPVIPALILLCLASLRICFGQRLIFVVTDYRKLEKLKQENKKLPPPITYEFAQQELARDFTDNIDGGKKQIFLFSNFGL